MTPTQTISLAFQAIKQASLVEQLKAFAAAHPEAIAGAGIGAGVGGIGSLLGGADLGGATLGALGGAGAGGLIGEAMKSPSATISLADAAPADGDPVHKKVAPRRQRMSAENARLTQAEKDTQGVGRGDVTRIMPGLFDRIGAAWDDALNAVGGQRDTNDALNDVSKTIAAETLAKRLAEKRLADATKARRQQTASDAVKNSIPAPLIAPDTLRLPNKYGMPGL